MLILYVKALHVVFMVTWFAAIFYLPRLFVYHAMSSDRASLDRLKDYPTDTWLLDTYVPDMVGGTGQPFNWDLAVEAQHFGRPIFLAGGLAAENVGEAIRRVRPYAVDVSSGVEAGPGKKDHTKVRAFIEAAKREH